MKKTLIFCLLFFAVLYAAFILKDSFHSRPEIKVDFNWSLKELGEKNNITPGELKKQLKYHFGIKNNLHGSTRLNELNLSDEQLFQFVGNIKNNYPRFLILKIILWSLGLGLVLQYVLAIKNKKRMQVIRAVIMGSVLLGLGFILGPSPNPMESIVQLGKYFAGFKTSHQYAIGIFAVFIVFSVIGPKLFCSWACPLGTLQESVFNLSALKNKRFRIPFSASIIIRGALFVAFLMSVLIFDDYLHGRSFFQAVNYFNIFEPAHLSVVALYTLPILFVFSFFTFRPFCHLICPFGFLSWFLEKIAISRVYVDKGKCIDCKLCAKACPTDAMRGILGNQKRVFQADCWSCGKCISACPEDAVIFK